MPDENQSTIDSTAVDNTSDGAATTTDSTSDQANVDVDFKIPSLDNLEYATPSAYIDPDLPANPAPIDDADNEPAAPAEEEPEETIEMTPEQISEAVKASNAVMGSVVEKITDSRNILIALSSDPSVDELAGALSLSLFLDRLGKHAIAVYSGTIPSSLNFLNPAENFEKNADVFQDFVISISKDKADHLRYKLEEDDVKIFVTPYKSRIVSEDLNFSYGDYNVDLVLALNVNNGIDLDSSLREYGTIMHDATVINITTGNPGKFGEIEWSNKFASSVSEMVASLLLSATGETKINEQEATTLLTGIVAATDRFAKANTFPGTMQIASRLLDAGADQQLVAANISDDLDNQFFTFSEAKQKAKPKEADEDTDETPSFFFDKKDQTPDEVAPSDDSTLTISHGDTPEPDTSSEDSTTPEEPAQESDSESSTPSSEPSDSALLDELKATEASLSNAGAETVQPTPTTPTVETVITPPTAETSTPTDATSKYSQMLEEAIATPTSTETAPMESALPPLQNPAVASAPELSTTPEVNNMPEINYGQTADDQILPPPPTPPVDMNVSMPLPTPTDLPPVQPISAPEPAPVLESEPAPEPAPTPAEATPSSPDTFTIPTV